VRVRVCYYWTSLNKLVVSTVRLATTIPAICWLFVEHDAP